MESYTVLLPLFLGVHILQLTLHRWRKKCCFTPAGFRCNARAGFIFSFNFLRQKLRGNRGWPPAKGGGVSFPFKFLLNYFYVAKAYKVSLPGIVSATLFFFRFQFTQGLHRVYTEFTYSLRKVYTRFTQALHRVYTPYRCYTFYIAEGKIRFYSHYF